METSITDNAGSVGNTGVKSCGTQAKASGKNTFAKGSQPSGQPNAHKTLTTGVISGGTNPGESDSGTVPLSAGSNQGVGDTLGILQGPGKDTERGFYHYDAPANG